MTKRMIIGAVLIGVAILLFFFASREIKPASIRVAAVGYTNTASGKAEALFSVSNMSRDVTWNIYALQQKTDAGWQSVLTPTTWSSHRRSDEYVLGVPVSSTNTVWRIVLFCQERRQGAGGLLDRGKEVYERYVTRAVRMRYDGRNYCVTNEFIP